MMGDIPESVVRDIVARALAEDIGPGDITTAATVAPDADCRAEIVAKAEGVIAGLGIARLVFGMLDPQIAFHEVVADGGRVSEGMTVARLSGNTRALLAAERTALNFLQRMSGIASLTAEYVEAVEGTDARIIDTRKTAPGLRLLDKYAVRMGGGRNHRIGLFDGVLIKDNHLRAAGGVGEAVRRARKAAHHLVKVEVEVQTLEEVEEAVAAGADVILLDNMELDDVRRAVDLVSGRGTIEVSGGVTLETVRALAESGVDYISAGALTHSAPALDLSLEVADD
ncbi:MAG: carboxylating nicotinate-nucleotide diphosphorylase [Armatimonadota bacterium]|nr:carboxylating nicotinate-nucleotide diphosphorylase [Armatimonadota bacterium]